AKSTSKPTRSRACRYQPASLRSLLMAKQTEIVSRRIDAQPEGALLRSLDLEHLVNRDQASRQLVRLARHGRLRRDRKSTRLNSSHVKISYAVFCLKKKKKKYTN